MAAPDLADAFQVGIDIMRSDVSDKTKRVLFQTGSVTGETTDASNVENWQTIGFVSRPPEADAGKAAAQAVVLRQGGHDACIATQDARGLALAGALKPGESCMYAAGKDGTAQARVLLKADGSVNLFTKSGNTDGGNGMGVFINPDGSISIASHNGAAVLIGSDGSIKLFNGSGGMQILADGHIKLASGSKVELSGASITLGGATALPLASGPSTVAAITALQVEIAAVAAALVACMNITGPILPIHGSTAGAATAAVGVAAAAIAGLNATLQTKRTSAD